jgi:hypothetical protein
LEHEQLHFNVTELYARKIRKRLKELLAKSETSEKEINSLINKLFEERDEYNEKLDDETSFGTDREKQAEWKKKVDLELNALNLFQIQ